MIRTKNHFRTMLLASTALVATGFVSAASAQSTIDNAGVISVAAGLEGFVAATSQLGSSADFNAEVTGADQTIDQTGTTIIDPQTIFGNDVTAETRLNQTTATVNVAAPDGGTFTGATSVASATGVSIDAGVGIASSQTVTDAGDVTANVGATAAPVSNSITLTAPTITGDIVLGGNQTIADALANDAMNSVNATANGTGNLSIPVAIANLQTFTPDADGTSVSAGSFGDMTVTLGSGNTSLTGDVRLDENVIGSRAGMNAATNELVAGAADGTAQGGLAGTLDATDLDTSGAIDSFIADFSIASLQVIDAGTDGATTPADTFANIASTTEGVVSLDVQPLTVVADGTELTARGNSILSEALGNDVTNRAIVTTDGLNGVSVGVASAQEITGDDTLSGDTSAQANFDLSAFTTGEISIDGGTTLGTAGGELASVTVDLSGNRIGAEAAGNQALNIAAVTSTGSLGGSTGYVAGVQTATNLDAAAVVNTANVVANFAEIANGTTGDASATLNGNAVFATAALNTQTNILQNSGSSAFDGSTMVSTSRQNITGGSVSALVGAADISLAGVADSSAIGNVSNNSVLASASGNVSTTSITNRSAGFSFTR